MNGVSRIRQLRLDRLSGREPPRRIIIVGIIAHAPVDVVAEDTDALLATFAIRKLECTTMPVARSLELGEILARDHAPKYLPGGCGANMAAGLARLGSQVSVVAPFGNDPHGAFARADLEARGVTVLGFDYDGPHSLIYTLITADRERTFADYCHGVPYDIGAAARRLDGERIVAIDGYLLLRLGVAQGIADYLTSGERPVGQQLVFCPGDVSVLLDAPESVKLVLDRCDHIVMNRNEAAVLFPGMSDAQIAMKLRSRGVAGAITQGEEGAFLWDSEDALHVPSNRLGGRIVNTNGAGDAFTAGYLHGIDRGLPLAEIARIATACAAEILVIEGARPDRVEARETA